LLLAPLSAVHAAESVEVKKPNVLFVVFDDLNNRLGRMVKKLSRTLTPLQERGYIPILSSRSTT
jgi:hypothetical protein